MPYIVSLIDPVGSNQSKYADEHGVLRYSTDNSEVFPGATGVRKQKGARCAVSTIQEARDMAVSYVHDRMDAFGEDRQALRDYGFMTAESWALDVSEDGGSMQMADDWTVDVRHVKWDVIREETQKSGATGTIIREPGDQGQPWLDAFNKANR